LTFKRHHDDRGFFQECTKASEIKKHIPGFEMKVRNMSASYGGVLRGLHCQRKKPQGKLLQCVTGNIIDFFVDGRKGSPTYGQSGSIRISGASPQAIWIPPGFLHGFFVESDFAVIQYECDQEYDPESDGGVNPLDPDLDIPILAYLGGNLDYATISKKDKALPLFKDWEAIDI